MWVLWSGCDTGGCIMDLNNSPSLVIPCDTIEHLKELVDTLYEKEILTDESIKFLNCPSNILDILNKSYFFEPVDIAGIQAVKGQTEQHTEDLL